MRHDSFNFKIALGAQNRNSSYNFRFFFLEINCNMRLFMNKIVCEENISNKAIRRNCTTMVISSCGFVYLNLFFSSYQNSISNLSVVISVCCTRKHGKK